jgi:aminoglycoside phosphotransferase family enzyme
MLYLNVRRLRQGALAAKEASRGKVDHADTSDIEKGHAAFRKGAHRTVEEKTEIGRQLLARCVSTTIVRCVSINVEG